MRESETYIHAPNKSIRTANGITYVYRELGEKIGIPIVFFTHLSANLDNWDPRIIDGIAKQHWVITFDNTGVGLSSGQVPGTIKEMAEDAIDFIKALGFKQIDILSLSMGGKKNGSFLAGWAAGVAYAAANLSPKFEKIC